MRYNIRMKKKKQIEILIEIIYYLVFIGFLLIVKSNYSTVSEYDFITFVSIASLFIGIMLLAGSHLNKYLGLIFGSVYSLYLIAQRVYQKGFGSYFRFSTALELGKEVAGQKAAVLELTKISDFAPIIAIAVITIVFLIIRYCFRIKPKYKWYIRSLSIIPIVVAFFLMNNMVNKIESTKNEVDNFQVYKTDFYLYDTINNPDSFVEKFGLLTFGFRDIQTLFTQNQVDDDYASDIKAYFDNKTEVLDNNDYTGLFKDNNLIIIQAESLMNLAISEELTPCLYNMINSSIEFTNFDTPLLIGSTSDSEFMANTSFIPESEGYSVCYKYVNNKFPLTLGNLFKENGYSTNAFHNNYAEYYNRNVTFANYGYDFKDCYALGLESEDPDSAITDQMGWIDAEKDRFLTFWISYSGHSPYGLEDVGVNEDNISRIKELYQGLSDEYVSYLAKIMDFDQAVQHFLDVLEWSNKREDTVVLIYGDHSAKGLTFESGTNYNDVFGVNSNDNPEITYTPMFIYEAGIEHQTVDKYCTCLDLLPTICNLWDIDYENKYAFGNDVLDDDYDGFCFDANGNYWNGGFYYDANSDNITTKDNYSNDKAQLLIEEFETKRSICNKILKIDYFANN